MVSSCCNDGTGKRCLQMAYALQPNILTWHWSFQQIEALLHIAAECQPSQAQAPSRIFGLRVPIRAWAALSPSHQTVMHCPANHADHAAIWTMFKSSFLCLVQTMNPKQVPAGFLPLANRQSTVDRIAVSMIEGLKVMFNLIKSRGKVMVLEWSLSWLMEIYCARPSLYTLWISVCARVLCLKRKENGGASQLLVANRMWMPLVGW